MDPQHPEIVFAGTRSAGLFKTRDGGRSWKEKSFGLPSRTTVWTLAIDPSNPMTIYAGTYEHPDGVYKTTDGGENWGPANSPEMEGTHVAALQLFARNPNIVFAGTRNFGIFRSTNGGATWQNLGLRHKVNDLAIPPTTSSIIYVATQGRVGGIGRGIFKSTDGGRRWREMSEGLSWMAKNSVNVLAIEPSSPTTLYAGTVVGVYKSTNAGRRWRAISRDLIVSALAIDPRDSATVYAGTRGDGVIRSGDGGETWQPFNRGLTVRDVNDLSFDANGTVLYAGTDNGVFDYIFRH